MAVQKSAVSRIHAIFSGEVQGIGFRYHAQSLAEMLGVAGWVRNLDDGNGVELVAEGKKETIEEFVRTLQERPPRGGRIEKAVVTRDEEPEGLEGFHVMIL